MNKMIASTLALTTATLTTTTNAHPLKPEQKTKIKPADPTVDYVQLHSIHNTRVRDDRTIDFYMNNDKIFRNTLPYACPNLDFEKHFNYTTSLSQLCSIDIITVLRTPPTPQKANYKLGKFQPITNTPK